MQDHSSTVYNIREPGLWPRSNTWLRLSPFVILQAARGFFVTPPPGYVTDGLNMMTMQDVENVTVVGYNATLRMHKHDYNSMPVYKPPSATRRVYASCKFGFMF